MGNKQNCPYVIRETGKIVCYVTWETDKVFSYVICETGKIVSYVTRETGKIIYHTEDGHNFSCVKQETG